MEIVTKENYWIEILNDKSRYGQIETEDKNFNLIADDIWKVVSTTFIDTEDEVVVKNWEDITQLSGEGLTIFQRKVNVLFTLTEKNYVPMSIIRKLIENNSPGKNYVLEFDKENNKLIIHIDRVDESKLEEISSTLSNLLPANIELVQYNHNIEISWKDINKYAECETVNDLLVVNADYKNDLTSDGEWIYPLTNMSNATAMFESSGIVKFSADVRHVANVERMFQYSPNMDGEVVFNSDVATNLTRLFCSSGAESNKINKITLNAPKATNIDRVCELNKNIIEVQGYLPKAGWSACSFFNCTNIRIFGIELPSLGFAEYFLYGAKLNKESALRVLNSIPSYSGQGTHFDIGIHVDHKKDEEVLAAIANAEAKGWPLSIQWNGKPTSNASTFGFGQLIYAKAGEIERPDGTTEKILDWGHYVTDPTGYETFHSLESAYEYFGLEMSTFEN